MQCYNLLAKVNLSVKNQSFLLKFSVEHKVRAVICFDGNYTLIMGCLSKMSPKDCRILSGYVGCTEI